MKGRERFHEGESLHPGRESFQTILRREELVGELSLSRKRSPFFLRENAKKGPTNFRGREKASFPLTENYLRNFFPRRDLLFLDGEGERRRRLNP